MISAITETGSAMVAVGLRLPVAAGYASDGFVEPGLTGPGAVYACATEIRLAASITQGLLK